METTDLHSQLVNRLLKIVAIGGAVAWVPSVYLAAKYDLWAVVVIDTMALAWVILLAVVPSLTFKIKIVSVLILSYGLGLGLIVWTGPMGAGHLFLFTFVFLAVLFFENRGIVAANALAIVTHAVLVAGSALGWLSWQQGLESVVVISINYILVSLVLTGAAQFLLHGYNRAAQEEKRLREVTEVLLREIEHRVKNNLQVISSLVSVRSRAAKTPEEALVRIRDSLSAMAAVQHLLYRDNYEYRVQLPDLMSSLTERFQTLHQPIRFLYRWTGPAVEVGSDQAVTLGLLLNEIFMNAIRHAFPPGGPGTMAVEVEFDSPSRQLNLTLADDGPGMGDATEGSGTKIIRALAQQLSAQMFRSGPGVTYRFSLTLPVTNRI